MKAFCEDLNCHFEGIFVTHAHHDHMDGAQDVVDLLVSLGRPAPRVYKLVDGNDSEKDRIESQQAVRAYIREQLPQYPSIDELAAHFNVSRSTLKRRLQRHNTSYKTLVDEMKMLTACELLESSRLSVDEISSHLYFSEGAAFRRAFKRCCGMSPSQYRKKSSLQ